ncbi:MAG: DUF2975 domain-containing protein [Gammaproteobacteria bacterium]|jgi:hypothetical protein
MAIILATAALLYAGLLFWFIRRVYLPRFYLPVSVTGDAGGRYRLARGVRIVLSFLHAFAFFAVISWMPFFVAMTMSQLGQPEWGIDVSVYSGFRIDVDELPSVEAAGLRDAVITGRSPLDIDSSNRLAWLVFAASNLVSSVIVLYVVLQLRNIFVRLSEGEAFAGDNVSRLRRVGITVIGAYLASPLVQYFAWGAVVDEISFTTDAIRLYPAFELNPIGMLIGLGALVLAGVIREAAELKEEQRLTV